MENDDYLNVVTYTDTPRMDNLSGLFYNDNGDVIGDSVILPEVTVRSGRRATHAPAFMQVNMYNLLLINESRNNPDFSIYDKLAYDGLMCRIANLSETKNIVGYNGSVYPHGSGALNEVYPEFEILALGRGLYNDNVFNMSYNTNNLRLQIPHKVYDSVSRSLDPLSPVRSHPFADMFRFLIPSFKTGDLGYGHYYRAIGGKKDYLTIYVME